MYYFWEGVEQNYSKAFTWCQMSADQGHSPAQHSLGTMYHYGLGAKKNLAEAKKWYSKAAQQGDDSSHEMLILLENC